MSKAGRAAGSRGRRKKPVLGYGPVAEFARSLRQVRQSAGEPTYRQMAQDRPQSTTSLAVADSGADLPSWPCAQEYLRACGVVDASELDGWRRRLARAAEQAKAFLPRLDGVNTRSELWAAATRLMTSSGLTADEVAVRIADLGAGTEALPPDPLCAPPPSRTEIEDVLAGRRSPDRNALGYLIFACGGTRRDVGHWQEAWERLLPAPARRVTAPTVDVADLPVTPLPVEPPPAPVRPDAPEPVRPPRRRSTGRRSAIALAAAAILAVLATGIGLAAGRLGLVPDGRAEAGRPITPPPPSTGPSSGAISAGEKLRELTRLVGRQPGPEPTGVYTYVHLRVLSTDTTTPEAPVTVSDERLWWSATDLSGRRVTTVSTPGGPAGRPRVETYSPNELPVVVRDPSADAATLRRQLADQHPPALGSAGLLRAIADLCAFHTLNTAQRVAVLAVLAELDGLTLRGMIADDAGRVGIAVSADADAAPDVAHRDTLIIDPTTGALYSHETVALSRTRPEDAQSLSQMIYLEHSRTDRIGS